MSGYAELSPAEAQELMQAESACVIDIRDGNSFSSAHITGAIQLDQTSLGPFLAATEKDAALVIYCYHGISSHSAASFFVDQGFSRVSHIAGVLKHGSSRHCRWIIHDPCQNPKPTPLQGRPCLI